MLYVEDILSLVVMQRKALEISHLDGDTHELLSCFMRGDSLCRMRDSLRLSYPNAGSCVSSFDYRVVNIQ